MVGITVAGITVNLGETSNIAVQIIGIGTPPHAGQPTSGYKG
jgi:hypothetical protein